MRWEDESYVKLYTRETADMLLWPWQAHAVWPNLLKKADNSGLLDTGRKDPLAALSLLLRLPREVVEPAIDALLKDGCVEVVDGGYLIRNFVEAQSARKTEAQKKRDYRKRQRDQRRAQGREISIPAVPTPSPAVPTVSPRGDPPTSSLTPTSSSASTSTQSSSSSPTSGATDRGEVEQPDAINPAGKRRRGPSPAEAWFNAFVEPERIRKLAEQSGQDESEIGSLRDTEGITPVLINSFAAQLRETTGLPLDRDAGGEGFTGLTVTELWWDYLEDPKRAGTKTTPYSFRYFVTKGVVLELLKNRQTESAA